MVGIHNIHLGYSDGPLYWVCLPDYLKGAGEGASKLHGLWGALPDHGVNHTWRSLVGLCGQVQDEPRPSVFLVNRRNPGLLEVFPK